MSNIDGRISNIESVVEAEVTQRHDAFWSQFTNAELVLLASGTASPELQERADLCKQIPLPAHLRSEYNAIVFELQAGGDPYIPELELLQ